jgi:hypothetical protein
LWELQTLSTQGELAVLESLADILRKDQVYFDSIIISSY